VRDLVLYDGHCRFCQAHVKILRKLDRGRRLSYLSLHDPDAANCVADIPPENVMREMYVVTDQKRYGGIDAVRRLTRRLPLLWWLAAILHIPGTRGLWGWLYRKIAGRRYWFGRLSCENETCSLSTHGR
jgi:predicted DCC family thiol-disulfide oxidoreductase YuxK